MKQAGVSLGVKRLLDVAIASVALVVLSPLLVVTAILIFFTMGRPVIFRQRRPGVHGKPFTLVKFRTMQTDHSPDDDPSRDEQRLTRLGSFLRSRSLDELPELLNILDGKMSFVGPRPLLMSYLSLYTAEQRRRHEVLPGLTGWAQVNGRNATTWEDRFRHDLWYVDHWSPILDIRILFRTVVTVIRGSGISQDGHATMPAFDGKLAPTMDPHGADRANI